MSGNTKIGFIGFGNMAMAIADGLLTRDAAAGNKLYACAANWEKLKLNTAKRGITPCRTAKETVLSSDLVILAVKPYMIAEVTAPIKDILRDKIVVSVAAGYPFEKYEEILTPGTHHISTIPNTPVSVGEGIFICENRHSLSDVELELFKELFSPVALLQFVDAKHLSVAGTISGCGPAFASMFMEALSDAAVLHGLPRDTAYSLAAQMIAGTGKLRLMSGVHPGAMKDAVCSPGGTTIKGVAALERGGLRAAVIDAVEAIEGAK